MQGECMSCLCGLFECSNGQCTPKVRSYGMCLSVLADLASSRPCDKFTHGTAGQGYRGVRHRLKLDVASKGAQYRQHRKESLVVVDKLKDRATHCGGNVPFVARSRGSRSGDSRAVNLVEVDRRQDCSQ